MLSGNRKGPLFMVAASLCWSLGGLCIKFIPWSAMSIVGLRSLLGALVFAVYRRSVRVKFTRGNIIGAICLSATTILYVFANQLTTAAAAILLQFSSPIFIICLELLFFRKKPKLSEVVAVTVTILGMLLFFADSLGNGSFLGNLLAIGSGLSFAGVFVANKMPETDPKQSIMLGFLVNAVAGLPFLFFDPLISFSAAAVTAVLVLGMIQVGLAYVFFYMGIRHTSALLACLITALEPVLNPLWVAVAFGEKPGLYTLLGGLVIVITVITYNIFTLTRQPIGNK